MDIGDIDLEDFQHGWRQARREWDQIYQAGVVVVVSDHNEDDEDQA